MYVKVNIIIFYRNLIESLRHRTQNHFSVDFVVKRKVLTFSSSYTSTVKTYNIVFKTFLHRPFRMVLLCTKESNHVLSPVVRDSLRCDILC